MARKKKSGFGKFIGSLGGNPYDRLMGQFERTVKQNEDDDDELANELDRFVRIARRRFDEGEIDDEEHDLLMEEVEDVHPTGKTYPRLGDSADEFYDSDDIPDAPELKIGKNVDLDALLSSSDRSQGSWGASEYDEYRERMAAEFKRESDEAIASGDHQMITAQDPGGGRVFGDDEDEAEATKRKIMVEEGIIDEEEEESDDGIEVDEDGVEWWEDEEGQWWYRPPNEEDWYAYEE
ncbi:MAG: hypothetical protein VYE51_01625 [Candidatus Thermoplasmatota archaeon]|nr:hypothetical protein [Candidatus Thermoplasmatota archaeon]